MIFKKILFLFKNNNSSGHIAHNRLKLLLITDRIGCNPDTTELIKRDIINSISKYIDIDKDNLIIEIHQDSDVYLTASVPIKEVKI